MGQHQTQAPTSGTPSWIPSSQIRYAQFLKVFSTSSVDEARMERRTSAILQKVQEMNIDWQLDLTDLQKKMFGLVSYD